MHKKKKIVLVLVLFTLMIWSFSCHKKTAYAAEYTQYWLNPLDGIAFGNDITQEDAEFIQSEFASFFDRANLDYHDYYIICNDVQKSNGQIYLNGFCIFNNNNLIFQAKYYNNIEYQIAVFGSYKSYNCYVTELRNYSSLSSFYTFDNTGYYKSALLYNDDLGYCTGSLREYGNGNIQAGSPPPPSSNFIFIQSAIRPFNPIIDPILAYPYNLDLQSQSFIEWLLIDNRYELINGAILSNHVGGWVDIFANYGGSSSWFQDIALQFIHSNNIGMGINDIQMALQKTKMLYQEYLAEKEDTVRNHLQRKLWGTEDIKPNTNDTNTTLITDDPNDSTDTSILRDILRAVISNTNTISDNFNILFDKLEHTNNTINIVNDGGVKDSSGSSFNSDYSDKGSFDITPIENPPSLPTPADLEPTINVGSYPVVLGGMANVFLDLLDTMGLKSIYIFAFVFGFLVFKLKGG